MGVKTFDVTPPTAKNLIFSHERMHKIMIFNFINTFIVKVLIDKKTCFELYQSLSLKISSMVINLIVLSERDFISLSKPEREKNQ